MLQQCLAVLAHESETKEQLAFLTVKPVMYTIDVRVYLLIVYDLNFVMNYYCYRPVKRRLT